MKLFAEGFYFFKLKDTQNNLNIFCQNNVVVAKTEI
jgi:hypothetical protein